ncbi:hypothetical protein TWF281_000291 [Arthrobotrys megalospora]
MATRTIENVQDEILQMIARMHGLRQEEDQEEEEEEQNLERRDPAGHDLDDGIIWLGENEAFEQGQEELRTEGTNQVNEPVKQRKEKGYCTGCGRYPGRQGHKKRCNWWLVSEMGLRWQQEQLEKRKLKLQRKLERDLERERLKRERERPPAPIVVSSPYVGP